MAKNKGTGMKRTVYRYIRDGIKNNYTYKESCEVCGTTEELELHHPTTVSLLFDNWCAKNKVSVATVDEVMAIRNDFYNDHWDELVNEVFTLCNTHHKALHKVFGSQPALGTAENQKKWVLRVSGSSDQVSGGGKFSQLATEPFDGWRKYGAN